MKIRKSVLTLLTLAIVAFTSCNNNELGEPHSLPQAGKLVNLTAQEYASIAFDNPKELTETEVIAIAGNFVKAKESVETEKLGTKSSDEITSFKVSSKYYYGKNSSSGILTRSSSKSTDATNVPIYELVMVKGIDTGRVIVSGDERAQKVIAYIPKANTEAKNISGADYLEGLAKVNLIENIAEINHLKDSLRTATLEKIADEMDIDKNKIKFDEIKDYISINDEPLSKFKPLKEPSSQVLAYVLPMCLTQWDQEAPFCNNLPEGLVQMGEGFNLQRKYPAGCGVVALAQLMSIVRPSITAFGTTINWTYLLKNPKIIEPTPFAEGDPADKREMVAKLFKDIYDKTGSSPIFITDSNGDEVITGVGTLQTECEKYIKNYATCSSIRSWDSDVVRNSILAIRPVLAMGDGHGFLIDGYLLCKLYYGAMPASNNSNTKQLVQLYDLYFHANLGWNGTDDGYYLINKNTTVDFETHIKVYSTGSLNIISNIEKKP